MDEASDQPRCLGCTLTLVLLLALLLGVVLVVAGFGWLSLGIAFVVYVILTAGVVVSDLRRVDPTQQTPEGPSTER